MAEPYNKLEIDRKLAADPEYFIKQWNKPGGSHDTETYRESRKAGGYKGGKAKNPNKGFGSSPERASTAGRIGGTISRRGK